MKVNWKQLVIKNKWLALAMIAMLPLSISCTHKTQSRSPPLVLPFEVKAGSKIETELHIEEHKEYIFSLKFQYKSDDPEDRVRVQKLVGEDGRHKGDNPGILTPIRFKIHAVDATGEKPILDQEIPVLRLRSWGDGHFTKHIAYVVLKPGNYRVSVESLKDAPELVGTPIAFSIGFYPKSTRTK